MSGAASTTIGVAPTVPRNAGAGDVDITVVVGSYNRAEMLAQTLESLTGLETTPQDLHPFTYEVVVVDNASTDQTPATIARFAQEGASGSAARVRGFVETRPGVTFARNRGIAEARGAWIAFHDDDQRAHPRWLAELLALAARRGVDVVGGAVHLVLPAGTTRRLAPACRVLLGEKVGWDDEAPYGRKRVPGTNNLMLRREVLDEVGVFDERIRDGGEDADLWRRIRATGREAWYTPAAIVYHLIPEGRLADAYMHWTASRHGQHLALREYRDWGRSRLPAVAAARAGQLLGVYMPRWALAMLKGDREEALGARALVWRSQAYLARAARLSLLGERAALAHDESMNLREGREKLLTKSPGPPTRAAGTA